MDRNLDYNIKRMGEDDDVPRKGNVDRNSNTKVAADGKCETFPARGTWIEISRHSM